MCMCLGEGGVPPCASYRASQLHPWLPPQMSAFLFSACVPVLLDGNSLTSQARQFFAWDFVKNSHTSLAPAHEMPVIVIAQNSSTHFLPGAPLLILPCTVDASLTDTIGSDSWLIEKVGSYKAITKTDTYTTFYFQHFILTKQLKVHSSLIF